MTSSPARLVVALSGGGRTLANLLQVIDRGELNACVNRVFASRPCKGVEIGSNAGIDSSVEEGELTAEKLGAILDGAGCDWLVLAGYLRRIHLPDRYRGQCVNIHPALLPDFGGPGMYGDRVHAAVLASGAQETGCTVHIVDDQYDHGPHVLQRRCPVEPGDTVTTLAARVFALEKNAYPEALRLLIAEQQEA
ncbi:MAG: formyltransferase family protein [Planctomycetota bacterium]